MSDDEAYVREAIDLAREAAAAGNTPFGSLLVVDGDVVKRSRNTTRTESDVTAHPELKLARWAGRELDADERAECTMYTSTEPCAMCAAAIHYAGLARVVYSVAGESLGEVRGDRGIDLSCREVIEAAGGSTVVEGPVLEAEGLAVHESFW